VTNIPKTWSVAARQSSDERKNEWTKRKQTSRPAERLFADSQMDMFEKSYEERLQKKKDKPVECLGMTFENDKKRRGVFPGEAMREAQKPGVPQDRGVPEKIHQEDPQTPHVVRPGDNDNRR
jgi:hypothetical protein